MYFLLVFLSLYLCISSAQDYRDDENYFITPGDRNTFLPGDVAQLEWTTNYTALNLGYVYLEDDIVMRIKSITPIIEFSERTFRRGMNNELTYTSCQQIIQSLLTIGQ